MPQSPISAPKHELARHGFLSFPCNPSRSGPHKADPAKTLGIPSPVGQATLAPASSWRWLFLLLVIAPDCLRRPVQDSINCSARKLWRQPTDPIPTGTLPRLWIAFNCIACSLSIFEPEAFLVRNPPKYAYTPESAHNQHAYIFSSAPPSTKDPPSIPSATWTSNPLIAPPRHLCKRARGSAKQQATTPRPRPKRPNQALP